MTLWLYSLLAYLLAPLLRWKLRRRGRREPTYLLDVEQRFGCYGKAVQRAEQDLPAPIWVHAVSMGEVRAAAILIAALRRQWPGMRLLLTNSTATGRNEGAALLEPGDQQVWLPWDMPAAVRRFLDRFQPSLGVLVETEVWPNLMAECRTRGLPIALVNARLNPRTLRRALRMRWLARPAYSGLTMVLAQSTTDAERLQQLGCTVSGVLGNLKFDATPDPARLQRGRAWRQRSKQALLMFASSREGEEQALLDLLADMAARKDGSLAAVKAARWLIVPRHPQRFDEVASLIESRGLSLSRRSQWADGPDDQALACQVWLGDSLGDMALYYGMSEAALLGGSFAPLGGQNLIEAAACECPMVMGPFTFNFAEAARLASDAGAAFQAASMAQAMPTLNRLLADPQALQAARLAGAKFSGEHHGCTARTVAKLTELRSVLQSIPRA